MAADIQSSIAGDSQEMAVGKYFQNKMLVHTDKKQLLFEFDDKMEKDR